MATGESVALLEEGPIHYRVAGPEDGPPIVFVHGVLVNGSLWRRVADRLAADGYRTYTPDWPMGSHRTGMEPDADLSPRGMAKLVLSFLASLGIRRVTLVGNDTGGAICQFVLDANPGTIERLVLTNCDAFEVFPPAPFNLLFKAARVPGLLRLLLEPTRLRLIRHRVGFGPLVAKRLDPQQTRGWVLPYLRNADVRRDTRKLLTGVEPRDLTDVASRLGRYQGPVLLCWAPEDKYFSIDLARRLVARFSDARLVEIPDSRTFVPHDQPERLAAEIAGFVPLA
ncbi:MAG TPA: alpha/beta hydrolase [Acidimicrobiales bacterium]|jgi:pimeloyl-ACP methyl ester carboxylesterase|nr:alpha/beta hydrolase [Acidimicrobiales bacterium]